MRYAAATNNGNAYSELVDNCRHSRLKAALSSHLPQASARTFSAPAVAVSHAPSSSLSLRDFGGEYVWLACMSVISLLSIVVTGVITA